MSKIVIALGGNALGKDPKEQLHLLESVARIIVDLVSKLLIIPFTFILSPISS